MKNIFKIILTTFRIIFKLIKFPFAFLLIIFALLDFGGIVGNSVSDDSVVPLIGAIIIGGSIIYSGMKKKEEDKKTIN